MIVLSSQKLAWMAHWKAREDGILDDKLTGQTDKVITEWTNLPCKTHRLTVDMSVMLNGSSE